MSHVGVTRLADITGLDRVGIPTYSAVVPKSSDIISVYNGKGATKLDAMVGALMEAIERHAALEVERELVYGSYSNLCRRQPVLDPASVCFERHPDSTADTVLPWVEGFDVLGRTSMLVPMELAGFNVIGKYGHPCYLQTTTNGLASGNTLEEAICHALCEVIERDAWAIAEMLLHRQAEPEEGPTAQERYPSIEISGAGGAITRLARAFERAGLTPIVKDITSDLGIPTVFCSVAEDVGPALPLAHFGLGTHPDVHVAVTRALTEAAQSRVVDIHGVREDVAPAETGHHPFSPHTRRARHIDRESWYHCPSLTRRPLSQIESYEHGDILADIRLMLARIHEAGVHHVVVVDLTRRDVGVPVVRIIAPGLESTDFRRLGWRGIVRWLATA